MPDVDIDLFRVDKRQEFDISDRKFNRRYTPRIQNSLIAKLESICSIYFMPLKYDIIHCNYSSTARFLRGYECPLILTTMGYPRPEVETRIIDKLAYTFEQWCIRHLPESTNLVTVSNYAKDGIKSRYGLDAKVIHNGIDCNYFCPSSDREKLKSSLGLQNKRIVLSVGRLHPLKDPFTLVDAFEKVSEKVDNVVLVVVGRGELEKEMKGICRKKQIKALFMGNVYGSDLLSLYQIADVFAFTSLGDSLANVLAEAMACKCPCVASNAGSNSEMIDLKDLLIEPRNSKAFAEAIVYLLENPTYSEQVTNQLLARVKELFSIETMADQYFQLYRTLAQ